MSRKNKYLAIFLSMVIVLVIGLNTNMISWSVLPTWEGLASGVWGFAPPSSSPIIITQDLTFPYSWISRDIHSTVISISPQLFETEGRTELDIQNPVPKYSSFTQGREVDYWIKDLQPNGDYVNTHVFGVINQYTMSIAVRSIDTGGYHQRLFQGGQFWLQLKANTWDMARQYQDTSGTHLGSAWEAPIAIYIEKYGLTGTSGSAGLYSILSPDNQGAFVTLYDGAGQYGTLDDLGVSANADINTTLLSLGDPRAPDSRMQSSGYFPITLVSWGEDQPLIGVPTFPIASYTMIVFTLQLGKYTLTVPADEVPTWEDPELQPNWWRSLITWLANPWNLFGVSTFVIILFAVLMGVALFWFVGMPVGLVKSSKGRKK